MCSLGDELLFNDVKLKWLGEKRHRMVVVCGGDWWVVLKNSLDFWRNAVCRESIHSYIHSFSQHLTDFILDRVNVSDSAILGPGG